MKFLYSFAVLPILIVADFNIDLDNYDWVKQYGVGDTDFALNMRTLARHLILEEEDCGDVCDTSDHFRKVPGKYFDSIKKFIDCDALFESTTLDRKVLVSEELVSLSAEKLRPPIISELPLKVAQKFTYHGRVPFFSGYLNDLKWTQDDQAEDYSTWTEEDFEWLMKSHKDGTMRGAYDKETTYNITQALQDHMIDEIKHKHILVIGSQTPWIEAILLNLGAAKVTTLEYTTIESAHPKVEVISIEDLKEAFKNNIKFDSVVTFSSLEHSGLGRYGDSLDPWGDLITMGRAWCMTKPGGKALVGVPSGMDGIVYNVNRIYGKIMLPHLFANWNQIWSNYRPFPDRLNFNEADFCNAGDNILHCYQPIFIVQKDSSVKTELEMAPNMSALERHLILEEEDCGGVCDTSDHFQKVPGKYFDIIKKFIDCNGLFESGNLDRRILESDELIRLSKNKFRPPFFEELPAKVAQKFTFHGRVPFFSGYFNDVKWTQDSLAKGYSTWTEEAIKQFMKSHKDGTMRGPYGKETTYKITQALQDHMIDEIKDKHVLVIGSQRPWFEAILLNLGAAKVTTLEYAKIKSAHPKVEVISIEDLKEAFKNNIKFDSVVTFSSLEHSGLGRYGDSLDPWGDLIAMGRAWCMTKPGGKALVGVPSGMDGIVYNGNRIYGEIMLPHLFANWNQIWSNYRPFPDGPKTDVADFCTAIDNILHCYQPIFIVQKDSNAKAEL